MHTRAGEDSAYDVLPYATRPLPHTHPDRLAVIGSLFGMRPAPIDRCRVLELGCGDGLNLIAMAGGLPRSRFLGLDLAVSAIDRGRATVAALGLANVELRHADIAEASLRGHFDYIVAHGLYSWAPEPVRDRILAICSAHLTPHGVAYVSYNTYPGGHLRQAVREILGYRLDGVADPERRLAHAEALARLIATCPVEVNGSAHLREEMRAALERGASRLFHDDLAPTNVPVYFHEFASHAGRHGLRFLAEANLHESQQDAFPTEVRAQVRRLAGDDVVQTQQYLDFVVNRRFRQSLLCRREVPLESLIRPDTIRRLRARSAARAGSAAPDIESPGVTERFRSPNGAGLTTSDPLAKVAIHCLGRSWPRLIDFDTLLWQCGRRLGAAPVDDSALCDILAAAYSGGLIELSTRPSR
jgi:SAM-dependent methyltransferase